MSKLSNPLAVAAVATNKDVLRTTKTLVIGGGIVVAGYYGWKKYKEWQKQKFVEKYAHMPDVQAAMVMYKSMFSIDKIDAWPFGSITIPDGTDEAQLNSLALKVSSLENVIKAYKVLFDSNLMSDILSELDNTELQKFFDSLGAKSEYDSQFNPDGSIKPQTPFSIGTTIQVLNTNGTTIYKAIEKNGEYQNSGEKRDFMKYSEVIGEILKVYKGVTSGQYYYVVDVAYSADFIYGHGWVAHKEVKRAE
ncbi:hypothetical protein [Flavobacterium sp. J27]|uniref:hypothetical protein n=1 Tax=Flavobacterium sp. J27 TaxID=2060419 RepID=UPI00103011AB|nr:hypothetical protein [Flavobacterium sp. J27]